MKLQALAIFCKGHKTQSGKRWFKISIQVCQSASLPPIPCTMMHKEMFPFPSLELSLLDASFIFEPQMVVGAGPLCVGVTVREKLCGSSMRASQPGPGLSVMRHWNAFFALESSHIKWSISTVYQRFFPMCLWMKLANRMFCWLGIILQRHRLYVAVLKLSQHVEPGVSPILEDTEKHLEAFFLGGLAMLGC